MPYGFQVFSATGELEIDLSTSLTRVLGRFQTGNSQTYGSVTDANFAKGIPWFVVLVNGPPNSSFEWGLTPEVSIDGTTLSWSWPAVLQPYKRDCHIIYGIR